jgi:hypothetical protein
MFTNVIGEDGIFSLKTKTMKLIKSWANKAYKSTQVNWAKTQAGIYKMLGELGIYQIRFTNLKDKFALEFLVELKEDEKPRAVRIIVPIKYSGNDEIKRTKELNIVHRILFNHLKAKFIAIQAGLTEFEEEFMAHLLITDKNGNSRTMGEVLLPQYTKTIEDGKGKDFKLLEEPDNESAN